MQNFRLGNWEEQIFNYMNYRVFIAVEKANKKPTWAIGIRKQSRI